jgi:hypothetical protein
MDYLQTAKFPHAQSNNGALILWLLRDCKTFEALCKRFENTKPLIPGNTTAKNLYERLCKMRDLGLVTLKDEKVDETTIEVHDVRPTALWQDIRVAFGGMSLSQVALLSSQAPGMAVEPVFGRPNKPEHKIDIFVLMPFTSKLKKVYTEHIKKLGAELGITIERADDHFEPDVFMRKVWEGICAARLIIADCTRRNPNVFYEIGMAHTVGKKVVLLTSPKADIPSDIRHFEYIEYDPKRMPLLVKKLRVFIKRSLGLPQ